MPTQPLSTVIATNIRRLRRQRGWTQADLIVELNKRQVQWSRSTAADVESPGRRAIPVGELLVLAMVFGEPVDALLRPHEEDASAVEVVNGLVLDADEISTVVTTGREASDDPVARELVALDDEVRQHEAHVHAMETAFDALKKKHQHVESLAEENVEDAQQRLAEAWLALIDATDKQAINDTSVSSHQENR